MKTNSDDPRVLLETNDVRAIAPKAKRDGSKVFLLHSPIIVEERCRDALGCDSWRPVGTLNASPPGISPEEDAKFLWAMYRLLAAGTES